MHALKRVPMEADYKVKLDVFEGPLDLLLYLIKKEEVDIYDIPIERITSQYDCNHRTKTQNFAKMIRM